MHGSFRNRWAFLDCIHDGTGKHLTVEIKCCQACAVEEMRKLIEIENSIAAVPDRYVKELEKSYKKQAHIDALHDLPRGYPS